MGFDFGYVTIGKLTSLMPTWNVGDEVSVWGPLGNGFPVVPEGTRHVLFVAGGIGQTPFLAMARETLGLRQYGSALASGGRQPNGTYFSWNSLSGTALAAGEMREFVLPLPAASAVPLSKVSAIDR